MTGFSKVKTMMSTRLPGLMQTAAVYSVIVLFIYGWTIYWFLWKLPSWLYFMTAIELLTLFAYSMVVNLLESFFVLLLPLFLSILLPVKWFRDRFVARGSALVVVILAFLTYYSRLITGLVGLPSNLGWMLLAVAAAAVAAVFIFGRVAFLRRILEEIANRAVIFLFISFPISAISLLVVLIRNLFA